MAVAEDLAYHGEGIVVRTADEIYLLATALSELEVILVDDLELAPHDGIILVEESERGTRSAKEVGLGCMKLVSVRLAEQGDAAAPHLTDQRKRTLGIGPYFGVVINGPAPPGGRDTSHPGRMIEFG